MTDVTFTAEEVAPLLEQNRLLRNLLAALGGVKIKAYMPDQPTATTAVARRRDLARDLAWLRRMEER